MNDKIITLFVNATKIDASQLKEMWWANVGTHSYITKWKDITFDKMKAFIAILFLIELIKCLSFDFY